MLCNRLMQRKMFNEEGTVHFLRTRFFFVRLRVLHKSWIFSKIWTKMLIFTIFAIFSGRNSNSWNHLGFDARYNYVLATLEKIGSQRSCQVTSWWHAEYTAFKKVTFLLFFNKTFRRFKMLSNLHTCTHTVNHSLYTMFDANLHP